MELLKFKIEGMQYQDINVTVFLCSISKWCKNTRCWLLLSAMGFGDCPYISEICFNKGAKSIDHRQK